MTSDDLKKGLSGLIDLADDEAVAKRLRKMVATLPDDLDEKGAAEAYAEFERELTEHSDGTVDRRVVRKRAHKAFSGTGEDRSGFYLLFESEERQFAGLASLLVGRYAEEWRRFYGKKVVESLIASAAAETPWKDIEISAEEGLNFDPMRMRSVTEVAESVMMLFDEWYRFGKALVGTEIGRRLFERAYHDVADRYGYLPTAEHLLGATPMDVLEHEKAERIHSLETKTTTQARSIVAADEDLERQADRLRATVEELEETKRKLEVVSHARSEFIDVVSHQFRTPLSSIRWNAELLTDAARDGKIDEEYHESIDMMRIKSVYLIDTLERVFMTLDIDTDSLAIDRKPAFLWEIVQNVHDDYAKEIERKDLEWTFKRTKAQVEEIPLDKSKIETALRIIIGNAVNYSDEGGKIAVDVRPESINGDRYMTCTVRDEGIGLSEKDKKQFWEKFFRSGDSKLKAPDGTGLGNYVVKHIVEAHDGRVWVESPGRGEGTMVGFSLPVEAKKTEKK